MANIGDAAATDAALSSITGVIIDPRKNVIRVAARNAAEVEARLHSLYGQNAAVVVGTDNGRSGPSDGRMMAGEKIRLETTNRETQALETGWCTGGYGAFDVVKPPNAARQRKQYLFTTGHCGLPGTTVSKYVAPRGDARSYEIGTVEKTAFPGGEKMETDALAVRLDTIDPPRNIYRVGTGPRRVTPAGRPRVGDELCFSGYKSGILKCGEFEGPGLWDYDKEFGVDHGLAWTLQFDARSIPGDSGAPVWDKTTGYVVGLLGGHIESWSFPDFWNETYKAWAIPLLPVKWEPESQAPGVLRHPAFAGLQLETAP